jgi:CBS-domain-containing membrane protein
MRRFVKIKLPKPTWREVLVEFIGALIGIGVLVGLGDLTSVPLLWAPLGGTLVLVFGAHASPYSQPMNVLGGHLLSAGLGLILLWILPHIPQPRKFIGPWSEFVLSSSVSPKTVSRH